MPIPPETTPPAEKTPPDGTTTVRPPAPERWWRKPEVIVAIIAAIISLFALRASWNANTIAERATESADKAATRANQIAESNNRINEMHRLAGTSNSLQTRFADNGIDDIPKLADFFFELGKAIEDHNIDDDFYKQQINVWCPITRRAHDKLTLSWIDNKVFRDIHKSTPWYLNMLDKLVGSSSDAQGGCL